ncbi:NAD(P)H-binding protein [Neobacillus sp. Marseille-QA0830]
MNPKTALILGASGLTGRELVDCLIQQNYYQKIHLFVRRPIDWNHPICEIHEIDYENMDQYADLFDVNDVFCCLGTTIKKAKTKEAFRKVDHDYPLQAAKLAVSAGTERFLIISAMGADPKSLFFYNQVKGQLEENLKNLPLPALHIFRPSLLLGERGEFRFGEQLASKASPVLNSLMKGPLRPFRAIEAKKVALAMAAAAKTSETGIHIYLSHEIEEMANKNVT